MATSIRIHPTAAEAEIAIDVMNLVRIARKAHPDKAIDFTLKPEARSDAQNDFLWPLIRQIGKHLGQPNEEITKNWLLVECYGEHYEDIGGRRVQKFPRTSKMSKKQMTQFLEFVLAYAAEHGVPLMAPPGLEEYLS